MGRARRKKLQRRNNFFMLIVILFMILLNMPTLIKTYLLQPTPESLTEQTLKLISADAAVTRIHFTTETIVSQNGEWVYLDTQNASSTDPTMLAMQWLQMEGTYLPTDVFNQLKQNFTLVMTVEVWQQDRPIPQRITVYQSQDQSHWLMNNWQSHWIAVTAKADYLLP